MGLLLGYSTESPLECQAELAHVSGSQMELLLGWS